jgi:hypothetical protein
VSFCLLDIEDSHPVSLVWSGRFVNMAGAYPISSRLEFRTSLERQHLHLPQRFDSLAIGIFASYAEAPVEASARRLGHPPLPVRPERGDEEPYNEPALRS